MEVVVKGVDQMTPVMDKIDAGVKKTSESMQAKWASTGATMQKAGIAAVALGAGIEMLARANAPLLESTRRLADYLDLDSKAMQQLVIDTSNVTFPLKEVLDIMETGTKLGLESAESLKKYAEFWDMVGDATGESAPALAEAGASLKALGIAAGEEGKALAALGFIQRNTTMSIGDFINSIGRLAPEIKELNMGINESAVILGIMQREFGMTSRVAMQEFRTAVTSADGDVEKLKTTLGITGEMFDEYSQKVAESSEIIKENAIRNNELYTPIQKIQHALAELKYRMGDFIQGAAGYAPLLTGMGSAMTIMGTLMKSSFFPKIMLATKGVWAFTASILANPITWWIIGITAVIAAIVLLWKNWEKITEYISRSIDWIGKKVKWLGDAFKWVAEKLGIYKEEVVEIVGETENLKDIMDETTIAIDNLAIAETEAETAARLLAEENAKLGTSLDSIGEKAKETAETFEEFCERMQESREEQAEAEKKIAEEYMASLRELENEIGVKLPALYDAQIQKIEETRDKYIELIESAELTADKEIEAIQKVLKYYDEQIAKLNDVKKAREGATTTKPSNLYKIVDAEGNTLGIQSGNILSQAQKDEGITLVKIHKGGLVRTTIPGGEGIALLKDEEIILRPGEITGNNQITLNIHEGAFKITTSKLDEGTIRGAGKWLFEEFYNQCRINNIVLQRG